MFANRALRLLTPRNEGARLGQRRASVRRQTADGVVPMQDMALH